MCGRGTWSSGTYNSLNGDGYAAGKRAGASVNIGGNSKSIGAAAKQLR